MESKESGHFSELRQDLVSGAWVAIATGRARRPSEFAQASLPPMVSDVDICPFETLDPGATLIFADDGEAFKAYSAELRSRWFAEFFPNKYPSFSPQPTCAIIESDGPYRFTQGVGFHEVMVTRPHDRSLAQMTASESEIVVRGYRARLRALQDEECVEYVSLIHNHGPLSGASISHPHSQLIAIPVIPPDVSRSLAGSRRYFEEENRCVHCVIVEFELQEKKRVVFENEHFVVVAPFASHAAFELRIFPKRHEAEFPKLADEEVPHMAEALRVSLAKLFVGLNNPSYNFFIHTAPAKNRERYGHYHWHIEILPKTAMWGGFEFGTGIEISTIKPEGAADFLRSIEISR